MAQEKKVFTLVDLPYEIDALAPSISAETLELHWGKHHAGYVAKLNAALETAPELAGHDLEGLVKSAPAGKIFNCAAQDFNHGFYWKSLSPSTRAGANLPDGPVAGLIAKQWGSFDKFKEVFTSHAGGHFGSGWAWLVQKPDGTLAIEETHDAGNPLRGDSGDLPVLTIDVWEHAYYVDYRNRRPDYIAAWWDLINWNFANENLAKYGRAKI